MRFFIKQITLWLKNGNLREIKFKENKVNIITGASGTGKTEILTIIDYCFFSSEAKITEEKINENVNWYGITFGINDSIYTIARASLNNGKTSNKYYFSSYGEIPNTPFQNNDEGSIKKIIENEFSLNKNLIIPYGGKYLKTGSKMSIKYFQLFTTQSEDTIVNKEVFFDKQNIGRYKEALERIFDIAFKIDTVENMLIGEKTRLINKEIVQLERKQDVLNKEGEVFEENMREDIRRARELQLISDQYILPEEYLNSLKNISDAKENFDISKEKEALMNQRDRLVLKIRNLKKLEREYKKYVEIEKKMYDSLKPIEYIKENFYDLLNFPETALLIQTLEGNFKNLKKNINVKHPFNINIKAKIETFVKELNQIDKILDQYSKENMIENGFFEKISFIGEMNYKIRLYESYKDAADYSKEISDKKNQLETLEKELLDISENKTIFIDLLEELIQNYLNQTGDALGNYKGYKALFDYKSKTLKLRKPNNVHVSNVGSSSNYLFMHLSLFLALHEASIIQKSEYIPQYFILDQPSRPYYGEEKDLIENITETDKYKIERAMELLNDFIKKINEEYKENFQVIVLEHIPKEMWGKLENFYLVEEFRNGNALIREEDM